MHWSGTVRRCLQEGPLVPGLARLQDTVWPRPRMEQLLGPATSKPGTAVEPPGLALCGRRGLITISSAALTAWSGLRRRSPWRRMPLTRLHGDEVGCC
ncbi:hypothetical protein NDU88_000310 [Pleurodeles waltl]|uniref:Uncharacterized protein n=1 Tax=Pleurodeles waltl TaxID=8319 RepID=A0AAV7PZU0_PLEWA|nr:hypothetical protein NDU88_000310 [Pleurodeles waltl]